MTNYPPGTWSGDPRAPWNQPDMTDYIRCFGCGYRDATLEQGEPCPECNDPKDGVMYVPEPEEVFGK